MCGIVSVAVLASFLLVVCCSSQQAVRFQQVRIQQVFCSESMGWF
jgi:uncharacterized protein YcfL